MLYCTENAQFRVRGTLEFAGKLSETAAVSATGFSQLAETCPKPLPKANSGVQVEYGVPTARPPLSPMLSASDSRPMDSASSCLKSWYAAATVTLSQPRSA